jgi:hypothetical protein
MKVDKYISDISTRFEFWRFLRIAEECFVEEAEVGDLVLCMTKKKLMLGNGVQPDRIGIIIKLDSDKSDDKSELYVLRAGDCIDRPLILQTWNEFRINKRAKYSECWYRHLYCNRNEEFMLKTQNFIQEINENPFVNK